MVPKVENDIMALQNAHPLWKSWLHFKIDAPTPQDIEAYDRSLKKRQEIALEYDKNEAQRELFRSVQKEPSKML